MLGKFRPSTKSVCLALLLSAAASSTATADGDTMKVSRFSIYRMADAHGLDDILGEALRNPTTKPIVVAVAAYFGVPPEDVEIAQKVLEEHERRTRSDTSWSWQYAAGPGYTICNAFISEIRSHIGKGAISIKYDEGFLNFYASVYRRKPTGKNLSPGRSSVSLQVEVVSAPSNQIKRLREEGLCLPKGAIVYEANWKDGDVTAEIARRHLNDDVTTKDIPPL